MSDIEHVVSALTESGPGVATGIAAMYVAKKVLGPSLDAVGEHLKGLNQKRLSNLGKISEKARVLRPDEHMYPHPRMTQRVLNDATLYDDDVQQTYVAGMLAGSRNDDGSDDRPVFYLSLIDGLTAAQLTIFHGLYSAADQALHGHGLDEGMNFALIAVDLDDLNSQLSVLNPSEPKEAPSALWALAHAGLIENVETWMEPKVVVFRPTRIGAILFDWAYGFDDEDFNNFTQRDRPDIGLPDLRFTSLRFSPGTNPPPPRPA